MALLRKVVSNRKCGLRLREAVRAAMLDRSAARLIQVAAKRAQALFINTLI